MKPLIVLGVVAAAVGGFLWSRRASAATLALPDLSGNRAAFLSMIRKAEGTDGDDGYRMLFGGKLFNDYADHPRIKQAFRQTDGITNYTTAAGAYQMIATTWDDQAEKLGLDDFSPDNQDRAAIGLVSDAGAIGLVDAGSFDAAVQKVSHIWASLPFSPYPQPKRSIDFVRTAFQDAGGTIIA